ncbi:MAG: undecaprenyl/decaprenyl-phosphate alpha-N-acetylglucosaminyl 1-phosphate transferase, partial [Acidobacteria bacterium]|nr:undecaprenyl/decaprenyl-phosphate alpha-N-acetylglucosaminyl 1-phosphate transferase [Acidobacteriota bacterium]
MRTYFFLLMLSTLVSFGLTQRLARIATARGWTRNENGDSTGVPRLGGVSVFATALIMMVLLILWDNQVAARVKAELPLALGLAGAAGVVFLIGLYDDLRGARPWQKLLVQGAAALGLYITGFRVEILTNPFTHSATHLGWLSLPLTLLWLVAISNAFNLIDGLDGLAAGVGLFATVTLFLLAMLQAKSFVAAITVALAGALFGFLPHNFNPAKIYLGDSGSLTIGLVLAALSIDSSQKGPVLLTVAIPLMIFGLPLLDVSVTTARRFLSGQPLFRRDEEHLHHRLQKIGMTPRGSVLLLYGLAALFALASLLLVNYKGATAPLIALLCGILAWLVVRQMQYAEFAELDSHVRTEWRSQRRVLRNQILLRKAGAELRATSSVAEAWGVARHIFEALEFTSATCELDGHSELEWKADGVEAAAQSWTLTIPLAHEGRPIGTLRLTRPMYHQP